MCEKQKITTSKCFMYIILSTLAECSAIRNRYWWIQYFNMDRTKEIFIFFEFWWGHVCKMLKINVLKINVRLNLFGRILWFTQSRFTQQFTPTKQTKNKSPRDRTINSWMIMYKHFYLNIFIEWTDPLLILLVIYYKLRSFTPLS